MRWDGSALGRRTCGRRGRVEVVHVRATADRWQRRTVQTWHTDRREKRGSGGSVLRTVT
jgi:hypothetical protein